ncbi:MAG: NrsF family protein [Pseudomonadota bacterium]
MSSKDQFIQSLQAELTAVKPLKSPVVRSALWCLATFGFSLGLLLMTGPLRPGVFAQLAKPQFLAETILGFLPLWTASYALFRLNIPGIKVSSVDIALSFFPFVLFSLFLVYGMLVEPALAPSMAGKREHCVVEVAYVSVLPLIFLLWQLKQGYSLYTPTQFMLMGIAASSVPMAAMQMICMYDPTHNLKFHFGPALVVAFVSTGIGTLWYRVFRK